MIKVDQRKYNFRKLYQMIELVTEFLKVRDFIAQHEYIDKHKDNVEFVNQAKKILYCEDYVIPTVLSDGGKLPSRKHHDDLGLDLFAIEDFDLEPGQGNRFRTGVRMALPKGGILKDKSSSAWKDDRGRFVIVCGGVIDPGYRGELLVVLFNLGQTVFKIEKGKAFVQLVTKGLPIEVSDLTNTSRGTKGFGS